MSHVPMQTLRLLAATALVGMVLLAFAGQLLNYSDSDCPNTQCHILCCILLCTVQKGKYVNALGEQRILQVQRQVQWQGHISVLLAGHHEHQKATQHRVHFQSRRDLAGMTSCRTGIAKS